MGGFPIVLFTSLEWSCDLGKGQPQHSRNVPERNLKENMQMIPAAAAASLLKQFMTWKMNFERGNRTHL